MSDTNIIEAGNLPSEKATHCCAVCCAKWVAWPDGSWSLQSKDCGPCCNNADMETAPIVALQPDGSAGPDFDKVRRAYERKQRAALVEKYRGILCAICGEPFEDHPTDWSCPHRVRPRFKFPPDRPHDPLLRQIVEVLSEALQFVEEVERREDTHYLLGGKINDALLTAQAAGVGK